jgi:cell division protein FtsN
MDAYERYREFTRMQPKPSTFSNIFKMFSGFFSGAGSIGRFMTQSVFFWIGGVLAVFILFWGVNALNVQREQAMKTSYQEAPSRTVMKPPVGKEQVSATKRGSREGVSTVPGTETAPAAPAAVPVVSAKTVRPSIATRSFVIQVVTYPSEEYAEKIVTSLKREGFKSFFRESVRPTGATFYVVYVGGFGTAAEAQKQLARFRSSPVSKPFADAFVKTMEIKES